mmetsp:Transcript_6208/g.15333  ORF Transcript_6208/g.15333 Transcript_6208/m.15333 type:complete len:94 (-) Transcript_6208:91-372(-)
MRMIDFAHTKRVEPHEAQGTPDEGFLKGVGNLIQILTTLSSPPLDPNLALAAPDSPLPPQDLDDDVPSSAPERTLPSPSVDRCEQLSPVEHCS